jgi:hypothetical protein
MPAPINQVYFKEPAISNLIKLFRIITFIVALTSIFVIIEIIPHNTKSIPPLLQTKILWVTNKTFTDTFYPNIAVIVEFRALPKVTAIVHNINDHIPASWPIQIFHGKENEHFIRNSTLAPLIKIGKVFLTLMEEVYNKSRTNELLTNASFWKRVRGEKILFFQIDSVMCSNPRYNLTDFLQYDYIGSPWDLSWFKFDKNHSVGNGGFSLRTRSKILALLELVSYNKTVPEDVWYANYMELVNGSIPSVEIAKAFAVESVFYDRPLAVHRLGWGVQFQSTLSTTCPEITLLLTPPVNATVKSR